jgi:flagellar basal-body rod protein FlgG
VNVSLYQAAAALDANASWQEMVADNLASSSLPGYKRKELSLAAIQAGLLPGSSPNDSSAAQSFVIPKATTVTNFETGAMKSTGVSTDVAIDGKGFFTVQLPTGMKGYTRNGEFHVSGAGQLVSNEGYPVLGGSGPTLSPIQLDPAQHAPVAISPSGDVRQGDEVKGKVKLTDFDKPALLTQVSGSYFVAANSKAQEEATTATLRPGYIEGSNVSTVGQMVSLLSAMRGFEANQKIIQMENERMGHAISDLGNPN